MNNGKNNKKNGFVSIVKTIILTYVIFIFVAIVLFLVFPFVLFGPNDEFWIMLEHGSYTYECAFAGFYLNILQWLAR